jgi:formamidopyrimidine-DNA glycosylase
MPELPEVHQKKLHFDEYALNQKIAKVDAIDVSYILKNVSAEEFQSVLSGRHFTSTYRRGKYLFAKLDNDRHMLFHFGMSGKFEYYQPPQAPPRHERFAFEFSNGYRLGFNCPRKFAQIHYVENLDSFIREKKLGEDALVISQSSFLELMNGKKGSIKGYLLNQKHLAGMGNLYADEVCWQIGIHPASTIPALSMHIREQVFLTMQEILQEAIANKANYNSYPEEWMWNHRVKDGHCPRDGQEWAIDKVAGRTTYYCPQCQTLHM